MTKRKREDVDKEIKENENFINEINNEWKNYKVSETTIKRLNNKNIHTMTEIQAKTIEPLLNNKSIIGRALTGSGKTYAFLIPIIEKFKSGELKRDNKPKVIILNPTRELVVQTDNNAKVLCDPCDEDNFSLNVVKLYGGVD